MEKDFIYHKPVLVDEVITYLDPKPGKIYIDCTFGSGGHTKAILQKEPKCEVISFDWDKNAIEINAPKIQEEFPNRFTILYGSFGHIKQLLSKINIKKVDGILADFGTSQFQINQLAGFSFSSDTPLDMRMSPGHFKTTAYDVVNKAQEEELAQIFFDYGEEFKAKRIAKAIVSYRKNYGFIKTTGQLSDVIKSVIPFYSRSIHPATKVFQALRIFVNDELNNIKSLLAQSIELLNPEGSIVCISFHSLEDRIVKNFFRENKDKFETLTNKVVIAGLEELKLNPSSRSAKLRAAKKI